MKCDIHGKIMSRDGRVHLTDFLGDALKNIGDGER